MIIKPIENHQNHYIDEGGNVYRKMKPWMTGVGYKHVKLEGMHYDVHRLVAKAFIPNKDGLQTVNHIDGNKLNNHYSNLEWMSQRDNVNHYLDNGGTATNNFIKCSLYYGDELVGNCNSVKEASKLAETLGCSYSMINKYKQHKGYRIVEG